jgi:hypothetical protein
VYLGQSGLTPEEELAAICYYYPCGLTSLCPCPPGVPKGTIPAFVPQLPEIPVTGKIPWLPWAMLFGLVALALSRPRWIDQLD